VVDGIPALADSTAQTGPRRNGSRGACDAVRPRRFPGVSPSIPLASATLFASARAPARSASSDSEAPGCDDAAEGCDGATWCGSPQPSSDLAVFGRGRQYKSVIGQHGLEAFLVPPHEGPKGQG